MKPVPLLLIGLGGVGRALLRQILDTRDAQTRYGVRLVPVALVDSSAALAVADGPGDEALRVALAAKASGAPLSALEGASPAPSLAALVESAPPGTLVVDTTAADVEVVGPALAAALERGGAAALANKKPLAGPQAWWDRLIRTGRVGYEATVGAGLPVISTLRMLLDTGDRVTGIEGAFSGTLGFLMSELEAGKPFGAAVREAKGRGWTEPDPRDDLGGVDVARKALILARTLGLRAELDDVEVEPLFGAEQAALSVPDFMARAGELDEPLRARRDEAHAAGERLRYAATVEAGPSTRLSVGLRRVALDHPLAALRGADNLVLFHSARYGERPLAVRGPGAGVELTASALLADLLRLAGG